MYKDVSLSVFSNKEHGLGKRAFWFFFAKRLRLTCFLLFMTLVFSILRNQESFSVENIELFKLLTWLFLALSVIALALAFTISELIYRHMTFSLSNYDLRIKRGVLFKEEFSIPFRQIQNVEIERDLFQRFIGISSLIIITAGREHGHSKKTGPEGFMPIIDKEIAVKLRDELVRRANVQKVVHYEG